MGVIIPISMCIINVIKYFQYEHIEILQLILYKMTNTLIGVWYYMLTLFLLLSFIY